MTEEAGMWREIETWSRELGLSLDEQTFERLSRFVQELLRWNERMNLTRLVGPEEVWIGHVLDSLMPLRLLDKTDVLVDLGSGGGFPGIPLKIASPGMGVVLVEAKRKKCSFLQHVRRTLGLHGLQVMEGRGEEGSEWGGWERGEGAVMITRASGGDDSAVGMATGLVGEEGRIILMKGEVSEKDESVLAEVARRHGREVQRILGYRLPGLRKRRHIVEIGKCFT